MVQYNEKYFDAWASIIAATQNRYGTEKRIGYVDLFAGPGRYASGATSTPLRVLEKGIAKFPDRLVTIFNDKDEANAQTLAEEIQKIPGIEELKFKPEIWNEEVGGKIAREFEKVNKIPILAFIDPWGYKGLTLKLVQAFLKDWGCDCIFFFNYARINAGLSNPMVREHMDSLFGQGRAADLRPQLEAMSPSEREATIVNALALALREYGHRFVLPFVFKNERGTRTKHHLILVTKHFKGYEVMKDIMAKYSSSEEQGVPSFAYSPAHGPEQLLLYSLNQPLDRLRESLLTEFAGRRMAMREIYKTHSVDRPYLSRHYKEVLAELEQAGEIETSGRRSPRGFADDIIVKFPAR